VRDALIDALCKSSPGDLLFQSVHQHDNLRKLFADFVGEKIELLVSSDLRGALRLAESLNHNSIKNTIRIDTNLRKRLRVVRIDEILRRALRAGVFDEIGLKTLDEAVDKRGLKYSESLSYQHFYFCFPFVSFVDHKEIVSCGPSTVTARPVPNSIPRDGIHWVIPIRDDVLIVSFPMADHMRMVTARDAEMTWLSNPEVRKKGRQIEPFTTFVSVVELPDGRFSMGKKPFAVGEFPVGFPFDFVFCEAAKVWTFVTPMTSVGDSIDPEVRLDTRLTGWDCEASEKIDDSLPEFFASCLLPNATPMLDQSYLVPKPKELEETRLGSSDGQLGFFAQGTPDGVAWGAGIDGRKTSRKVRINERGVPICDIPLGMMDKPGSKGFWTFVKRQRDVHVIDESSGDEVAAFSSIAIDMPGQTCEILHPVFWNLYSVRCQQTSRQLRKVTKAAASRLLKAALRESYVAESDPLGEFTKKDCPHIRRAVAAEFPHAPERLARGLASTCIRAAKLKEWIDLLLS
jgi:hypothetical protein